MCNQEDCVKKILLLIGFSMFAAQFSNACDMDGKTGFAPENDLWIEDTNSFGQMTEAEFNGIIDRVEKIYTPIVESHGKKFVVKRNWKKGTVNAYATQTKKEMRVFMFGGMARHASITNDGFALVLCHELGHHLGGAPKISDWRGNIEWASNEGQADYWGAMKCFRKFIENDDNVSIVSNMTVDPLVKEYCSTSFSHENDIAVCERSSLAGLALGNVLSALSGNREAVAFTTPSRAVVDETDNAHPAAQCRLDTYFAGSVCDRDLYSDVSDTDANQGVCNRSEQDKLGLRPLCWFKPM